ncbi:60S ribosomal protein L23 [Chionoecetes opilio]|uniref:60S ribosomal protein L23 n=1 Tax=Chionoecetes opilio TaxID=41210 RepID=A0A8J5CM64_CHIOP|nr:60S ribosomal protein L23 [Chionoecetes opilio]
MSKRGREASSGGKSWISLGLPVTDMSCADNTGAKNLCIIAVQGIKGRLNCLSAAAVSYNNQQSNSGDPNSYGDGGCSDTGSGMGTLLVSKNLQEFLKRFEELKAIKKYRASTRPMMPPINNKMEKFGIQYHVRKVTKDAAWKLSCIRRVAHLLDAQGVGTLYKSQVRSLMEYSTLAWSSCPPSYLGLLDRVQARAQRLARLKAPEAAAQIIQPLQQRRDVAGMCVMYKAHRMQLLQLVELHLNPWARPSHSTRAAHNIDHQQSCIIRAPVALWMNTFAPSLPQASGKVWKVRKKG